MNRSRQSRKRKIVVAGIAAFLAILLFWLVLRFVVDRGLLDEQFGDSGEWGDEETEQIALTIGDKDYWTEDLFDTYLMIGTDAGGDFIDEEHQGTLADFLALLIVDNTTQKFGVIQIDRNTMVPMAELAGVDESGEGIKQQICLAHWYGENDGQRNDNTVQAVSELFGYLDVDNYYAINMEDIGLVNDAIGGVTVNIDTDMTNLDPAFVEGASVKLNAEQTEKFLRARMSVGEGTNKERMSRQTQYMQNAYNMVFDQLSENPEYINDIYDQLTGVLQSEERGANLSRMANHIMQYENAGILQIDGETKINDTQGDGIEHEEFYADTASIAEALGKIINLTEVTE
jgi:anionic cell wall polymer biosynthesis LytR-Cps2A-Psr (LCP) family protein